LDFGLAKVPASSALPRRMVHGHHHGRYQPGVLMGTADTWRRNRWGEAADLRADIFSLGATIYEMLTGKRAFKGETAIETLNAILKEDPPELDVDKAHIPPALERIVRHCLEKRPADRFQSARDLMFALDDMLTTSVSAPARAMHFSNSIGKLAAVAAAAAWARARCIGSPRHGSTGSRGIRHQCARRSQPTFALAGREMAGVRLPRRNRWQPHGIRATHRLPVCPRNPGKRGCELSLLVAGQSIRCLLLQG
jgi:hypothetical protein